jgi:hypothetical protein
MIRLARLLFPIAAAAALSGAAAPTARAEPPLPRVDEELMNVVLKDAEGTVRDQLDSQYRRFVRDYEEVFKAVGLPAPDVDPEIRNRRTLKAFKKLAPAERLTIVEGARKEVPVLVSKYGALDAQNKLDDPKAIDTLLDSFQFMSQMPVPTEDNAPVYFGGLIQRLGLVGSHVHRSHERDVYIYQN